MIRLTDEQLRELLSLWRHEPPVFDALDELLALRARVAELERERDGVLEGQKGIWIVVREAEQWKEKFRSRVAQLEAALRELVNRLDEIHADPAYKSVWTVHQIHVGPYRGPTYVDALARAREALNRATTEDAPSSHTRSAPRARP